MSRQDLIYITKRIDRLSSEIDTFAPVSTMGIGQFRGDLAGMLTVIISASYESCVKETIMNFASKHDHQFYEYTSRNYNRLNSKIALRDLYKYTKTFDPKINEEFKRLLSERENSIQNRLGIKISSQYEQILKWRHDYAHAGTKDTTIEEAMRTHRFGVRVLFCFNDAFDVV